MAKIKEEIKLTPNSALMIICLRDIGGFFSAVADINSIRLQTFVSVKRDAGNFGSAPPKNNEIV